MLVTSHPDKIYDALDASVAVLRDMAVAPVNRRELARARTTLITRHESEMLSSFVCLMALVQRHTFSCVGGFVWPCIVMRPSRDIVPAAALGMCSSCRVLLGGRMGVAVRVGCWLSSLFEGGGPDLLHQQQT